MASEACKGHFQMPLFPFCFSPGTPAGRRATVSFNVGIGHKCHNIKFISYDKGQPDIIKSTLTPKHYLIVVSHSAEVHFVGAGVVGGKLKVGHHRPTEKCETDPAPSPSLALCKLPLSKSVIHSFKIALLPSSRSICLPSILLP